ncbi:MAG: pilus assembly protein, partial [Chloroflexi bacterium]|nr:pilus assembly protein [Chloroflexota bacterium]
MNKFKKKYEESPGQALVEFALVISAVLMMMFLIIESARILWAWNTVQHAAREGARYAITGQFDGPTCAVNFGLAKFVQGSGRDVCQDLRVASIINISHSSLTGLPLNEVSTTFEDDNYYNIEIWGADEFGQLQYDFAGIPDNPVIVRVTYRVPIITPFFTPIRDSIPVFGQEVLNNESFGSLGSGQGQPLPPNLQPVPTPGVTPSPTPSPTPSDTPTSSPTDTPTATATSTPTGLCVEIEGHVLETNDFLFVAGNINETVDIIDLTTNTVLQSVAPFAAFSGHACDPPAG